MWLLFSEKCPLPYMKGIFSTHVYLENTGTYAGHTQYAWVRRTQVKSEFCVCGNLSSRSTSFSFSAKFNLFFALVGVIAKGFPISSFADPCVQRVRRHLQFLRRHISAYLVCQFYGVCSIFCSMALLSLSESQLSYLHATCLARFTVTIIMLCRVELCSWCCLRGRTNSWCVRGGSLLLYQNSRPN